MPLWGILCAAIGGAAAVGALIAFLLIRRKRKACDDNMYVKRHRHGKWIF